MPPTRAYVVSVLSALLGAHCVHGMTMTNELVVPKFDPERQRVRREKD